MLSPKNFRVGHICAALSPDLTVSIEGEVASALCATLFCPPHRENIAFLVGDRGKHAVLVTAILPTPNVTPYDPTETMAIGTRAWRAARRWAGERGLEVVGFAHSHPTPYALPSPIDLRYIRPGEVGAVFHPRPGTITVYSKNHQVTVPVSLSLPARIAAFPFVDSATDV